MIAGSKRSLLMTPEEYLEWEEKQNLKYEYLQGEVFAMTGGTIPHNRIAVNITTAINNHLKHKPCNVLMADAKVQIGVNSAYLYPDVVVTCDERDKSAIKYLKYPCLIIEVLSPATAAYDRGDRFESYRGISTLGEYVLVDAKRMKVEVFRLNQQKQWVLNFYSPQELLSDNPIDIAVEFNSIDFVCPFSVIYEDVIFSSTENLENE